MKKKRLFICLSVLIIMALFLYYQNNSIGVTSIELELDSLPQSFDGFKIVQLSDLHSKMFGENQHELVSRVKEARPDIIFFTGDLVDSKHYEEQPGLELMEQIVKTAPVYYVTGNHEFWSGRFSSLEKKLQELGVKILRNTRESVEKNGEKIDVIGVDDPAANSSQQNNDDGEFISNEIQKSLNGNEKQKFTILLSHRPELLSTYADFNLDLIFSGHAHGGQVRLPFIGGVIAPNQGIVPKYTAGKYHLKNSVMIVSRGLGNSIIPQRIFNRPEVVVVKLVNH
ncbi:metallophosphoesterase [Clostridium sp.]|uniref:metallophosphoesterase n=1 Tax=Clostridium sp. TaxID=1506 RepID=UPI001A3A0EBD|nr:metallophosphoesterase [Clostridium sp.]MBK5242813.1 metallophosphoesterase [Clostridium sp.]